MPQLIDIDINQKSKDIDVPILRQPKFLALLVNYLFPTLVLKNQVRDNLLAGITYSTWSSLTNYNLGDRVTVGRISYECIQPNRNNYVTNTTYWYVINNDNIGLTEKLNYNCHKMQLEYVLNKRFNTISSIMPPYNHASGNIYIETNPGLPRIAWIGRNNAISSYIKPLSSNNFFYHTKAFNYTPVENYFIWVPNTILSNISATGNPTDGLQVIRNETDKYNSVGITYNVQGY